MKVANEQPLILNLHDLEFPKIRELREKEFDHVSGGWGFGFSGNCIPTMTSTPNGDGGDDGMDPDPSGPDNSGVAYGTTL